MEKRFGPYLLMERIGEGGMGEVFRAIKTRAGGFEKEMAVKLILPHLSRDPSFRNLFAREARLAAALDHPNIVKVFGFEVVQDTAVMEMELVSGVDLRHLLRSLGEGGKLPLPVAALILHRTARGLAFAHAPSGPLSIGLVHRDLNPHNILLSREGEVKVADFGIARAADDGSASGRLRGKISYMSPEQLRGENLNPPSDLFGLGILAFQLLCGRHPFRRDGDPATMRAILDEDVPHPLPGDGLPKPMTELVMSLLDRTPSARPTAAEAVVALEPFLRPEAERELGARVALIRPGQAAFELPSPTAPTLRPGVNRWPWAVAAVAAAATGLWLVAGAPRREAAGPPRLDPHTASTDAQRSAPVSSAPQPSPAGTVEVMVVTHPAAARLLAEGRNLGVSPLRLTLPAGSSPLFVTAVKEGYADISFRVDTSSGNDVSVRLDPLPTGSVRISALPWARVRYNGEMVGETPVTVSGLPVGRHTFILENDALGVRREVTVDVAQGLNTRAVDLTTVQH